MNATAKARVTLTLELPLAGTFEEVAWTLSSVRKDAQRTVESALNQLSKLATCTGIQIYKIESTELAVFFSDKKDT